MKKIIALIIAIAALFSVASAELYPAVGVVDSIDFKNDLVTFEDYNGNLWAIEGIEDWMVGDMGALLMDDMGTAIIYDDVIVMAHYAGFTPAQ